MTTTAGTTCTLTIGFGHDWTQDELPVEGDFLRSNAGSCYRIDSIKPTSRPRRYRYSCTRLDRDAVAEGQPGVYVFRWHPRTSPTGGGAR